MTRVETISLSVGDKVKDSRGQTWEIIQIENIGITLSGEKVNEVALFGATLKQGIKISGFANWESVRSSYEKL